MFTGNHVGRRTSSGGSIGVASHGHSPRSASQIFVNTRLFSTPPRARIHSRALAMGGEPGSTPAIFRAR